MSPGDVQSERGSVSNVFDHLNATMGKWRNVFFRPVRWEVEAERTLLGDTQAQIDEALLRQADFGIAIFRERFGTLREDGDFAFVSRSAIDEAAEQAGSVFPLDASQLQGKR